MIGDSFFSFYKNYNKKISNKSLDLLKDSYIIKKVDEFMNKYKPKVEKIIKPLINENAEIFLDRQASIEKGKHNIRLENKRSLKGFKKTNDIFYKNNFYYISQKYILSLIIISFFDCLNIYKEELDKIINSLLEKNADKDIKDYLDDCFFTKLEEFTKKIKIIDIKIKHPSLNIIICNNDPIPLEFEKHSIDLIDNFNEKSEKFQIILNIIEEKNWYPFKQKNWQYLNENSKKILKEYLEKNMIQDSYFIKTDNDNVFNSLKEYEKNDLINFFEYKKKDFIIKKINNAYNTNHIYYNNLKISNIISSEQFKNIFINKIKKENEKIKQNVNFGKIEYLSIIIIGKSGVGKSTLLNGMLKEELAGTGGGRITTLENKAYKSKLIPFLKLYDTRGIELNQKFGPKQIYENAIKIINSQSQIGNDNYNDYIQCIWYCFNNSEVEEKEIGILKQLRKNENSIPIIVVFTNAQIEENVEKIENIIKENFKDIPFIPVLAKENEGMIESCGLDNLLNETLKICKKSIKGNIFKKIREKSVNNIEKIFIEKNKSIKKNINNDIVKKITNDFKKV